MGISVVVTKAGQDPLKIFLEIFQEFLAPIGELTIAFSRMETALTWAIGLCLMIEDEEAKAIESQILSFDSRIKLFLTVGQMQTKDVTLRNELKDLARELERLNELRNWILHGIWNNTAKGGGEETKAAKVCHSARKKLSRTNKYFSISEIRDGARDMFYMQHYLTMWGGKITRQRQRKAP